ncbi:YgcG family protein [Flammeovirga sp. SJP92]|uniref:TPM domain-containing protein n=1 Tax=Flammeovirga sp. SJP92 TaxID=1775430 RepID=UPI000787078A|nr:TPM domain-containing protein [Flammeovirga sp. SJP92]KXX66925.1 hypothetical protein AVL50_29675 [Flammeovirga sp. SJP92]
MKNILILIIFFFSANLRANTIDDFVSNSFTYSYSVNDYSATLSENELQSLIEEVDRINTISDIEYSACIIPSLEGYKIRDVATSIGNFWEIGATKNGEGVLILISIQDRKAFIATSTKTKYTDGEVQVIVNKDLLPYLKNNNYSKGILQSIDRFENSNNASENNDSIDSSIYFIVIFFVILFIYIIFDFYKLDGFKKNKNRIKFSVNSKNSSSTFDSSSGGSSSGGFSGGGAGGDF